MTTRNSLSKVTKSSEPAPRYVKDSDRISELESSMATLTKMITESVDLTKGLSEQVRRSQNPQKIPIAQSSEARIKAMSNLRRDGDVGESRRVQDLLNPAAQETGFQSGDVVEIVENTAKFMGYRVKPDGTHARPFQPAKPATKEYPAQPALEAEEGIPARGVVQNYMYTKRNGQRKYKIEFPGFGMEGLTESEIRIV